MPHSILLSGHLPDLSGLIPLFVVGIDVLLLAIIYPLLKLTENGRHPVAKIIWFLMAMVAFICGGGFIAIDLEVTSEQKGDFTTAYMAILAVSLALSALLLFTGLLAFRKKWRAEMAKDLTPDD